MSVLRPLKAAYVSLYLTLGWLISLFSLWQLTQGSAWLAWLGTLLASAPLTVGISLLMLKPVIARTSADLPEVQVLTLAGLLLSAWGGWQSNAILPVILSLVSYIGLLLYIYWYSRYGRTPSDSLQIGRPLPGFSLIDTQGKTLHSHELSGHPSVMLFFRGNWCPLCMAQIREIAAQYREIEALGARVLLISPQPQAHTRQLAQKFDVNFLFLQDPHNQVARQLGILSEFGIPTGLEVMGYETEAPMPTVIITDATGTVVWVDETDNYRVRPEPGQFLKVLRTL